MATILKLCYNVLKNVSCYDQNISTYKMLLDHATRLDSRALHLSHVLGLRESRKHVIALTIIRK